MRQEPLSSFSLRIYSDKENTADDSTLDKILKKDISRQRRRPFTVISVDASNCYDQIHHMITVLFFFSLGVHYGVVSTILSSIKLMKFFLRTGWVKSLSFIGGDPLRILHWVCRGNSAATTAWLVPSSVLVHAYKACMYDNRVASLTTRVSLDVMGILYIDDTSL
jgi:hypothetical protein